MSAALSKSAQPEDNGDAAARQWLEYLAMRLRAEAGGLLILKPDGRRILHRIGHTEASRIACRDCYSRLDPLGRRLAQRPHGRPLVIDTTRPPDYLAQHRLTPAEAGLAVQLANGHSPEAIAEMRQVKRDTVRNQLKAIYRKTGYNRQNSLVSAILSIRAL